MQAQAPKPFRVINTAIRGGRANVAFDQALIDARKGHRIPDTIRFLQFRPSALIGIHQILSHEVRVEYCKSRGIEIARRITGGGALYLDEGQIGWELVFAGSHMAFSDLGQATRRICESAALGLRKLGIPANYRPRNDIEVDGRKISGTGGFFDGDTLFYQGTLLIDFDPQEMIAALKVPVEKLAKRDLASAGERIVTMREILGEELPDLGSIYRSLLEGFAEGLGILPQWGSVSAFEEELAEQIFRDEIGCDGFVEMLDAPEVDDATMSASLTRSGGSLRADIRLEGPSGRRIREALITGDFFVTPPRVVFDLEAALRGAELAQAQAIVDEFWSRTSAEFLNLSAKDIQDVIAAAARQLSFMAAGRRLCGQRIAAKRADLPPVVLLHDALGCTRLWRDVPERLAAQSGCSVLVYDRWGSGDSAPLELPHARQYLLDEALKSLPQVLVATQTERPILIGHSDGATIALAFAGAFPHLVSGVVAIAPHLFREERTVAAIADQIRQFEHGDLKARLARYHGRRTELLFGRLVEAWTGDKALYGDIESYIRAVQCPVLAIQGTEDEFFTRVQVDALCALLAAPVETCYLPGCGHAPHQQAADLVIGAAARFIARVASEAAACDAPASPMPPQ
jgi:lipoate---protein ligase